MERDMRTGIRWKWRKERILAGLLIYAALCWILAYLPGPFFGSAGPQGIRNLFSATAVLGIFAMGSLVGDRRHSKKSPVGGADKRKHMMLLVAYVLGMGLCQMVSMIIAMMVCKGLCLWCSYNVFRLLLVEMLVGTPLALWMLSRCRWCVAPAGSRGRSGDPGSVPRRRSRSSRSLEPAKAAEPYGGRTANQTLVKRVP